MHFSLSPFVPENSVSRDGFGRPVPRHLLILHTKAESAVLTHGIEHVELLCNCNPGVNTHKVSMRSDISINRQVVQYNTVKYYIYDILC